MLENLKNELIGNEYSCEDYVVYVNLDLSKYDLYMKICDDYEIIFNNSDIPCYKIDREFIICEFDDGYGEEYEEEYIKIKDILIYK